MDNLVDIFTETIKMSDGQSIHLKRWTPRVSSLKPVVIQIAHGMAEHIQRYDEFAKALVKEGWIVHGHDHRGHGSTAKESGELGYFADEEGWERVIKDLNEVTRKIKAEYPDSQVILFGHSMGSFLARRYVQLFPQEVDALILSGTGCSKGLLGRIGIQVAALSEVVYGKKKQNKLLDKLAFGGFNVRFEPTETSFDWLSRDPQMIQDYIGDPLCGFIFTTEAFYDMLKGIEELHKQKNIEKTPKNLPLYIFSGECDPVGDYGKGVKVVYETYVGLGIEEVHYKLYPGGRHEMLNEINREEVYRDIIVWIKDALAEKNHSLSNVPKIK
ncbi:alpha/beta hydrolase fold [Alkaliphilus metalliredigens QYMF]|uniref:Alpha/beta hydrolase fold n=1 Tax=Alkaliphilus metalliredigens (strain QYMF) TaxID=293826 RepID=A6TKH2_ALKMQ|nr:alpha/beta hydrolase [Alkaliphilus metalliredigens]ABR46690.1 alpha/beta hydrolase fold [Alkaliphilus metalliredigens QYMF]